MESWWLDELSTAGPEHLDPGYVAAYDAKAQFDPGDDVELLRQLGMDGTSTVIDLGAGTGTFAVAASRLAAEVIAVDPSPAMTGALRERVVTLRLTNVTVVQAGFLTYHHQGDPADFVFSRNALHQLPDFWKVVALRQIGQLLRPGGVLRLHDLVFDVGPDQIEETVDRWMSRAVADPARGYTAPELAEHLRSEHSTFTWLLDVMLDRAGFDVVDRQVRNSVYAAYTCRRR